MKLFCIGKLRSLKVIFISKPPLVVVISSVVCLSLVILAACFYINNHQIRVENFMKDWNLYLEKVGGLHFCIKDELLPFSSLNSTTTKIPTPPLNSTFVTSSQSLPGEAMSSLSLSSPSSPPTSSSPLSVVPSPSILPNFKATTRVSVQMQLTIQHPSEFRNIPYNLTSFNSYVHAEHLGITTSNDQLHLSTTLHHSWHDARCHSFLKINCDVTTLHACVTLEGDASVFPDSILEPNVCGHTTNRSVADIQYTVQMDAYKLDKSSMKRCHGNMKLQFKHRPDPSLNVYLSMDVKFMIIKRLVKTSVVMLAIVLAVLFILLLSTDAQHKTPSDNERLNASHSLEEKEDL